MATSTKSGGSGGGDLTFTPLTDIASVVAGARAAYDTGRTKAVEWRRAQLQGIKRFCDENKEAVRQALAMDLHRPELECDIMELVTVVAEVDAALANLSHWMKPEPVETPTVLLPAHSYIQYEPLGVVCIIGPWNFPLQLVLNPLVAAVAAGNAAVIKPSEVSPRSAQLLEQLLPRYVDKDAVRIVQGAVPETSELLKQKFDHILYTGNGAVGRVVLEAAAKHLTPVTLELGGKCPAIIDADVDVGLAAKRLVAGKCMNAGQVCLAPDYLLVHRDAADAVTEALVAAAKKFYGPDMKASPDFGRIVNNRHFQRVTKLLDDCGGKVVFGGDRDPSQNYVSLTLVRDPSPTSPLMSDEIFGPVLPILTVANMDEAIAFVNKRPKPLALYVFTQSSATAKRVLASTSSGGAVVNDTTMHKAVVDLPFHGVGPSGMGEYQGHAGFRTMSNRKSVLVQPTWIDPGALRYPPYNSSNTARLEWLLRNAPRLPSPGWKDLAIVALTAAVVALAVKLNQVTK